VSCVSGCCFSSRDFAWGRLRCPAPHDPSTQTTPTIMARGTSLPPDSVLHVVMIEPPMLAICKHVLPARCLPLRQTAPSHGSSQLAERAGADGSAVCSEEVSRKHPVVPRNVATSQNRFPKFIWDHEPRGPASRLWVAHSGVLTSVPSDAEPWLSIPTDERHSVPALAGVEDDADQNEMPSGGLHIFRINHRHYDTTRTTVRQAMPRGGPPDLGPRRCATLSLQAGAAGESQGRRLEQAWRRLPA